MNKSKFNSDEEKRHLEEAIRLFKVGGVSLRVSAQMLSQKTGIKISHEGLRKIINKKV